MDSKEILLEVLFSSGRVDHYIVDNNFYRTRIMPWFKNTSEFVDDVITLLDINGFETMIFRHNVCMIKSIDDEQEIDYYKKLGSRYKTNIHVKL